MAGLLLESQLVRVRPPLVASDQTESGHLSGQNKQPNC
ncbi:hypothetical protein SPHINGO8AM_130023 [Sphingomonas sp. 8AM]|nr:hypothetical protein SPHINGO8AM_130023 [Sphingomonas sp. 8AM]